MQRPLETLRCGLLGTDITHLSYRLHTAHLQNVGVGSNSLLHVMPAPWRLLGGGGLELLLPPEFLLPALCCCPHPGVVISHDLLNCPSYR